MQGQPRCSAPGPDPFWGDSGLREEPGRSGFGTGVWAVTLPSVHGHGAFPQSPLVSGDRRPSGDSNSGEELLHFRCFLRCQYPSLPTDRTATLRQTWRGLGLWSVHTHSYRDVARASPLLYLCPGFGLLPPQSSPTDSPDSLRALALLTSCLV